MKSPMLIVSVALPSFAAAQTIAQINGNKYLSPYAGKAVSGVVGLVTAKGPSGFYMRSTKPDNSDATSESIYVYGKPTLADVLVGDIISLNGTVAEYRSSSSYVYSTEIQNAKITTVSSGNTVTPVVLGNGGRSPPTDQYTSLDHGNIFAVPNNKTQISVQNPTLQPTKYGMDFWQSLQGEYVTISSPRSVSRPNQYGDTWVVGNWPVTGLNGRGGLTLTNQDANPESIVIIDPLDGSTNGQDTKLGDGLADITGIVNYAFGFYSISPNTKIQVTNVKKPIDPPATNITSTGNCNSISVGQWNVENLAPNSTTLDEIASQIVTYLKTPDLILLEEIQDNSGPTDNGVVSANQTLSDLVAAIKQNGGTFTYEFIDIDPINDSTGGQPGGNIRNAYIWNPNVLQLYKPNPGTATQATKVTKGPHLSHNPGYIYPGNAAWDDSRTPIVAEWTTLDGTGNFFTINVHWVAKSGSSSLEGDLRTPVNLGVQQRTQQATLTGKFAKSILAQDQNAAVIVGGDMNEFVFVQPVNTFEKVSGMKNLDAAIGTPAVERYTYIFDQNCEQLQHLYVSNSIASAAAKYEHIHVSTWLQYAQDSSDHDPSVAQLNVCS